jgi:GntR family transcriptional regulator
VAKIDPDSPVPKYFQLREILLDLIESNELPIGAAIPSERDLSQRFGLSRMTVRQAVDHLVSEGRLHRVPGKGTFVARPKIELALQLTSFTDDMRARGLEPGSRDLDRRVVRASAHLARQLGIQPGDAVHFIERLRTADGEPLSIERAHIPVVLAPDLDSFDLTGLSLYALLESRYGIVMDAGELTIDGGVADPNDADLLKLPRGGAVLLLQRRSFTGGACAELGVSTYRADRYQLRTLLEIPPQTRVPASSRYRPSLEEHL